MKNSKLSLKETQLAIEILKDVFSHKLKKSLNLTRVSAPLFVRSSSGLNDGLSGEKPVSFRPKSINEKLEIVHSLAKWKRDALYRYNFDLYHGIYTDMNAIRQEEIIDNTHSFYVDQWDWEMIIAKEDRDLSFLKKIVNKIYQALKFTEKKINSTYVTLKSKLPKKIFFIDSLKLYNKFPNLSSKEREYELVKKYGAIFIYKIGYNLPDNIPHSNRAKDYDDWNLNGDLIVYDELNDIALELSSMGIRVDANSLQKQYNLPLEEIARISSYHQAIIENKFPLTIGGGIGQSRIAMFLLEKKHIGEVQVSVWDDKTIESAKKSDIILL
ncbi:aspartate--ammonia ligase [Mycoplasma enhydrae]|uniref:aspartate--ammonia ligase n=1 Tax=Mycoplasma enhydrae TaxID=2499220 RepID=UPI00197B186B|nr:aspartate--ammonia ligase [Mycoplasma enhydrae]MBN4089239.1 aspartate--ammonia ligase [Mycoplasma enhydrae]MCV3733601.1 aspartate--ammonia ligase [Mycoplasma enhydrae]MCV3753422.1 aspartate--ammonia ligase [Mycoplasma enhydrae]